MVDATVSCLERTLAREHDDEAHALALDTLRESWPQFAITDGARVRAILDSIPSERWHDDPWLVTCYAASFRSEEVSAQTAALPYFEAAVALISAETPAFVRSLLYVRYAAALRALGHLADAREAATQATTIAESGEAIPLARRVPLAAEIAFHRGAIALHEGDFDSARADLRLSGSLAERNLNAGDQLEVFGCLALIQFLMGDFEQALEFVKRATATIAAVDLKNSHFNAPGLVTEMLVTLLQRGTDAAEPLFDRVLESIGESEWQPLGLYGLAFADVFAGKPHDGLERLRQAHTALDGWQEANFVASEIRAIRAAAFLQLGDNGSAWDELAQLPPTQHHTVCPSRLIAHLRFVTGDARGALDVLHSCEELGDAHSSRALSDVFLIKAAAHWAIGNEAQSNVAFDRALRLAARNRMHSPFRLVPSEAVHAMLNRAATRPQPLEVGAMIKRLDGVPVLLAPQSAPALSKRERSIARELVKGHNSAQIAESLFISVNTVKSHLKSVYRKLGVSTRVEAIQRSRELGLQVDITLD